MKKMLASLVVAGFAALPVSAATQTVTLSLPTMTCATCPITVKQALSKVDGVIDVKATWEPKEAVVTFDDTKTSLGALTSATANVGYPSAVKP